MDLFVSGMPLWEELSDMPNTLGWKVRWLKVPSHVPLFRNIEADFLPNQGKMSNPGYATPCKPIPLPP